MPDTDIQRKIADKVKILNNEAELLLKEGKDLKEKAMELFERELVSD